MAGRRSRRYPPWYVSRAARRKLRTQVRRQGYGWLADVSARYEEYGHFDGNKAGFACAFIEQLPHVKGIWAGETIELQPVQRLILQDIFGIVDDEGYRIIRKAYWEVPRKNAKTTTAAAVGNLMLQADREPGAEIYSAADDKDQAWISWNIAYQQALRVPALKKKTIFRAYRYEMALRDGSFFVPVERDAGSQHGYNAHCVLFDEVHVQRSRELWDVLTTSEGSRRQPLVLAITTAGFDRHSLCWDLHAKARQLIRGMIEDPAFYPVIFSALEEDRWESDFDWQDRSLWKRANPMLGVSVREEFLEDEARDAVQMPHRQNVFKRLYLNIWTQAETRAITPEQWEGCRGGKEEAELYGLPAYGALDLASTTDITAFILTVPVGDEVHTVHRFWCPRDTVRRRSNEDGVPYQLWVDQGRLIATPGNCTDYDMIEAEVFELAKKFKLERLNVDRWQAEHMSQHFESEGIEVYGMGQGFRDMTEPSKKLETLILGKRLRHPDDPVMNWMIDNLMWETDAAGNRKPSKKVSTEKIDGPVALIMAISALIRESQITTPEFALV